MVESSAIMDQVATRLGAEFGPLAAGQILQVLVSELGGVRFTFPDLETVNRMERNRQIRLSFKGNNTAELATRHGLHQSQIRRIVSG